MDYNTLYEFLNEKKLSSLRPIKDLPLMFLALFSNLKLSQVHKTNENEKVRELVKYLQLFQNFEK